MKPVLTLVVRSRNGDAAALAAVACRRAVQLGLEIEVVTSGEPVVATQLESELITAVVPSEFAAAHHEAWCLLCQLSILRSGVDVSILVLGAESHAAFAARQRAAHHTGSPTASTRARRVSA